MVVGLLGNENPDLNRFTLVTPKPANGVRLQATLDNQNPTGLPVGAVSTLLAPHFVDRLPSEDWMIIDDNRRRAVVHPADQPYYLTSLSEEEMSEFLARESAAKDTDSMTALWKTFFQTIGIKERKNPVCQRNLIPLWYRKHMSEMQD